MRRSDHVIDLGPGAGMFGGQIVYDGKPGPLFSGRARGLKDSPTAKAFADPIRHPLRGERRPLPAKTAKEGWLKIRGACANNLKNVNVDIPLGWLTVITGISGSGKSSLMRGVIAPGVEAVVSRKRQSGVKQYRSIAGAKAIQAIYEVDQTPIGKTSRSTPATYVKVFDEIRKLFAALPASKVRGYTASRFSFNSEGGRCETCSGNGADQVGDEHSCRPAMCHARTVQGCATTRPPSRSTTTARTSARSWTMTIEEAAEFFSAHQKIHRTLSLLVDTGLGYLQLGQPSPTLSGGEAQRIKLVTQLTRGVGRSQTAKLKGDRRGFKSLYLIEEPTIGLHMADVRRLLEVLHALVDDGHTVIVIEHNLDIIAEADLLIDIGSGGGRSRRDDRSPGNTRTGGEVEAEPHRRVPAQSAGLSDLRYAVRQQAMVTLAQRHPHQQELHPALVAAGGTEHRLDAAARKRERVE